MFYRIDQILGDIIDGVGVGDDENEQPKIECVFIYCCMLIEAL